jgi:hypothetical protein
MNSASITILAAFIGRDQIFYERPFLFGTTLLIDANGFWESSPQLFLMIVITGWSNIDL